MLRFGDSDDATRATITRVREDAMAYIGGTAWRGEWVMRVSVTSGATTIDEGRIAANAVIAAWRAVRD